MVPRHLNVTIHFLSPCRLRELFSVFISRRWKYLLFLFIFYSSSSLAQQAETINTVTTHYTMREGLSHNSILRLHKDSRGIIWALSRYGLNRFDGETFVSHHKDVEIFSKFYRTISEDGDGLFWLVDPQIIPEEDGSLQANFELFDPIIGESIHIDSKKYPFSKKDIITVVLSSEDVIYIITKSHQLIKFYKKGDYEVIQLDGTQTSYSDLWIGEDEDGNFHFFNTNDRGNYRVYNKEGLSIHSLDKLTSESFYFVRDISPFQRFWCNDKVNLEKTSSKDSFFLINSNLVLRTHLYENCINVFQRKGKDEFWYILENQLIGFHITNGVIYQQEIEGFSSNMRAVDIVWEGDDIYLGTAFHGVFKINNSNGLFKQLKHPQLLNNRTIEKDNKNQLWVGRDGRDINIIDSTFSFDRQMNREGTIINSFLKDKSGDFFYILSSPKFSKKILFKKYDTQLNLIESTEIEYSASLKFNALWTGIFQDNSGQIWLVKNNNFAKQSSDGSFKTICVDANFDPLENAKIYEVIQKDEDRFWLCTSEGIFIINHAECVLERYWKGGKGKYYLPTNGFHDIYIDRDSIFWLASKNNGLYRWNPSTEPQAANRIENYTFGSGILINTLHGIYEDKNNCLWISTEDGIIQFHKESHYFNIYKQEDGLVNNEFNRHSHFQDEDGTIYFGGVLGVDYFNPDEFELKSEPTPINLFAIEKFAKGKYKNYLPQFFAEGNMLQFETSADHFLITYGAENAQSTRSNRFFYSIDNKENWIPNNSRKVKLENLGFGDHQLHIKKESFAGELLGSFQMNINVPYPFYLEIWFLGLCFISLIGLLFLIYRWRTRQARKSKRLLEQLVNEKTKIIQEDKDLIEKQNKELKYLNESKAQFFNNIAHELRNPLTLIQEPAKIIEKNIIEKKQSNEILKHIQTIQLNSKKLLELSEEVNILGKLEARPEKLKLTVISLDLLIQKIIAPFKKAACLQEKEFQVINEIAKDLFVLLDTPKFEKVVNNLVSNALKYTPRGGQISLLIKKTSDQKLQVMVSDTGYGIDAEDLPFIFKPYYRSAKIERNNDPLNFKGGLGMGLPIAKGFAKLMQGDVTVLKTDKNGTSFLFEMPLEEIDDKEVVNQIVNTKDSGQKANEILAVKDSEDEVKKKISHILLVDDHQELTNFIYQLLEPNYYLSVATNGVEAIETLTNNINDKKQTPISLIISDIIMPQMDGINFLDEVKKHVRWKQLPFIFLTGYNNETYRTNALKLGVEDYIIKPFESEELLARIKHLLENYEVRNSELQDVGSQEESFTQEKWLITLNETVNQQLANPDFDLETLAYEMSVSKRQLNRKIKAVTGLPPGKYIQEVRLQKARKLLEQGEYDSVSAVCYSSGFSTLSYFSKQFKQRFGRLPSSYFD